MPGIMATIHPTAVVDPGAELDDGVEVGALAIVERGVVLRRGVCIEPHAQVLRGVTIGDGTTVGRGAVIGGLPQDLSFDPATPTGVAIGSNNVLREHVTVHRATKAGANTTIGDHNYLMVGAHVGHDSRIGDRNIIANSVLVAGHVEMGSHTVVGGGSVFHQFIRIGDYCMIQGISGFSMDLPHFIMAAEVNRIVGLNVIGMRRAGFSVEQRNEIKDLFDLVWRSGKNLTQAVAEARQQSWTAQAEKMLQFLEAPTRKGICRLPVGEEG